MKRRWKTYPMAGVVVTHATPHRVVSQILRPELALFLPDDSIVVRSQHDGQCCVGALSFITNAAVIDMQDILYAAGFPHLTSLSFGAGAIKITSFPAACFAAMAQLTHLKVLDLGACPNVNASNLSEVAKLTNLKKLGLARCRGVNIVSFVEVLKLTDLVCLDISFCSGLDNAVTLGKLATFTKLEELVLRGLSLSRNGDLSGVSQLTRLRVLDLSNTCVNREGLTDVAKLTQLTDLSLAHSNVGGDEVAEVAKLKHLTSIDLTRCHRIGGAGMVELVKLTELRTLNIMGCCDKPTDVDLIATKLTKLTSLDLSFSQAATADSLATVRANLTQLKTLRLRVCRGVDGSALSEIAQMSRLQTLDLGHCPNINASGLAEIAKLPLVDVNLDGCSDSEAIASVLIAVERRRMAMC